MKNIFWGSALAALAIMAAPAPAQLLGGGGLGGGLGGSLGGSLGGGLGGVGSTVGRVGSDVTGSVNGAVSGTGSANVDRRSGRASGNGSAGAAGGLTGGASGALGQLALAGTGAANASGSFDVSPGMVVEDVRGRAIGTVQQVRSTANGTVEAVVMKVGDATATLPAANFNGSGNVLVSAMGKGEVKKEAKSQNGSDGKQAAN